MCARACLRASVCWGHPALIRPRQVETGSHWHLGIGRRRCSLSACAVHTSRQTERGKSCGDRTKTVRSFVLSRLGYNNSIMAGCPKYLHSKLQMVQNSAARLIFRTSRSAHVTPMLHFFYWLPFQQRIEYIFCFALRSSVIKSPSTFQTSLFTRLPGSSALLQTPECSQYHPSTLRPVVGTLSLTRLQQRGTISLFLSSCYLCQFF